MMNAYYGGNDNADNDYDAYHGCDDDGNDYYYDDGKVNTMVTILK